MFKNDFSSWLKQRRVSIIVWSSVVAVIIFISGSLYLFHRYNQLISRVTTVEIAAVNDITHSFHELSDIHGQLFTLVHAAEQSPRGKKYDDDIVKKLDKLYGRISLFQLEAKQQIKLRDSEEVFSKLLLGIRDYRVSVLKAREQATAHPDLSHQYLIEATERFNSINRLFADLAKRMSFYTGINMQEEIEAINRLFWFLGLGVFLAIGFLIWVAFDFAVNLSGRFRVLGATLMQLRDGNTRITLPDYPSNSEMLGIIKSLEEFKTALDEFDSTKSSLYRKDQQLREESEQRRIVQRELRRSLQDLNKAISVVRTSNETRNHLLGNISRELKTQLKGITGITGVLLQGSLDEKHRESVQAICNACEQVLLFLNNILVYSSIETNRFAMHYSAFSLKELLDGLVSIFKDKVFEKKILLNVNIAEDVPDMNYGDPNRIRQVLFNLIHNAIKFTEYGQVDVNVGLGDKERLGKKFKQDLCPWEGKKFSADCDWRVLSFEVVDTGVGISKQKLKNLFFNIPHDEADNTSVTDTGLGLAIAKQLIDLMDGEIGINSRFYQGTQVWFRICLPCLADEA